MYRKSEKSRKRRKAWVYKESINRKFKKIRKNTTGTFADNNM